MKGIFQVTTEKGAVLLTSYSEDLDISKSEIESGRSLSRGLQRYYNKYHIRFTFQVLEETDDIKELGKYIFPHVPRVKIDDSCLEQLPEGAKIVNKIIDWFCGTFLNKNLTFELYFREGKYIGILQEDGICIEKYADFSKNGVPKERTFL